MPAGTDAIRLERAAQPPSSRRRLRVSASAGLGMAIVLIILIAAVAAPILAPYDPVSQDSDRRLHPPSRQHWLGTDEFGRDLFSRILFGARPALLVGFSATSIGVLAGASLGVVAGFFGGVLDHGIMQVVDVLLSFPTILLAIVIMAVLGPSLGNVMIAVGISRVPILARVTRGVVLGIRNEQYIEAAEALGMAPARVIGRHVVPNVLPTLIVQGTATLAEAIVIAAALNFLGLGVQPPTPDWGAMVSDGRRFIFDHVHIPLFPGLAIAVLVLSLNMVGDWLRDVLDPRLRGTG